MLVNNINIYMTLPSAQTTVYLSFGPFSCRWDVATFCWCWWSWPFGHLASNNNKIKYNKKKVKRILPPETRLRLEPPYVRRQWSRCWCGGLDLVSVWLRSWFLFGTRSLLGNKHLIEKIKVR
jgi:hypothetical protein